MLQRGKTLLIDGSNAVHAIYGSWPDSRDEQNENAQDFLVHLSRWAAQQEGLEVEAVFDGGFRPLQVAGSQASVRVIFSGHESADSVILERARAQRYFKKKVTVVTWDRLLAEEARREEAKVMSPERLWDAIRRGC